MFRLASQGVELNVNEMRTFVESGEPRPVGLETESDRDSCRYMGDGAKRFYRSGLDTNLRSLRGDRLICRV